MGSLAAGESHPNRRGFKSAGPKKIGLEIAPAAQVFVVGDRHDVVRDRIEGAFGVSELEQALKTILPG